MTRNRPIEHMLAPYQAELAQALVEAEEKVATAHRDAEQASPQYKAYLEAVARSAEASASEDAVAAVERVKAKWKPLWDTWYNSLKENDPGSESDVHAHRMNAEVVVEDRAKKIKTKKA